MYQDFSQEHDLAVFIECRYTTAILRNKIWDRVCLRNIQNFQISLEYFTVALPNSGTRFCVDT